MPIRHRPNLSTRRNVRIIRFGDAFFGEWEVFGGVGVLGDDMSRTDRIRRAFPDSHHGGFSLRGKERGGAPGPVTRPDPPPTAAMKTHRVKNEVICGGLRMMS